MKLPLPLIFTLMLSACGGGGGGGDPLPVVTTTTNSECTVSEINQWVDDGMRDYYLFYDQVPTVNLSVYDSPERLIRDLRVDPPDTFTYVTDKADSVALTEEGKRFGFGHHFGRDAEQRLRLTDVHRDSPMGRAGLKRSDIVDAINGISTQPGVLTDDMYFSMIGNQDNPVPTTWTITDGLTGEQKDVVLTQSVYNVNSVLLTTAIENEENFAGIIGYLHLERFISTSAEELNEAMRFFKDNNVSELVLDLRYNGGGLIRIANQLASHIAGPLTDNELLVRYEYNDRYTRRNFDFNFEPQTTTLGLTRLVVIVSAATASASEIVINSLRPYIDVVTIGELTVGKPFISSPADKCDKRMFALEAEGFNQAGVSVAGGIAADCYAADDITRDFGFSGLGEEREIERTLRSALDYIVFGQCDSPPPSMVSLRSTAENLPGPARDQGGSIR